jgi:hypothetical protein
MGGTAADNNGACGAMGGATAEDDGSCGEMDDATAVDDGSCITAAAPDLYLVSNKSLSPTEGHSFSMTLSILTSHFFSPQASTITPSSCFLFRLFT